MTRYSVRTRMHGEDLDESTDFRTRPSAPVRDGVTALRRRPTPRYEAPDDRRKPSPEEAGRRSRADDGNGGSGRGRRPWYKRPLVLGIIGLVLLAALAGGVVWWLHARQYETTDDAFIDTHVVQIASQVSGRVLEVRVNDNQQVEAGQLLVRIDPAEFQARLDQARGGQAEAQGRLSQAKAQKIVAEANLEQARADVVVAQANAANAAADLKRFQDLLRSTPGAVARQQYDNAVAAVRSNEAQLNAAQKKVAAAEAQVKAADSEVQTAQAHLQSAAAEVEQAELTLSYTEIKAPEAGRIANRNVAAGNYLATGTSAMALVPRNVWVTANYKETQLDLMRPGQPAEISIDAYPDRTWRGHVDSIQAGSGPAFSLLPPENATGNYVKVVQRVPVKIVFDEAPDPQRPLGPGMSVEPSVKVR